MPIVHQNEGEADLLALTTLGVNVKEGESPIGYFGTGFKYAIPILLRNNHRVFLQVGEEQKEFRLVDHEIRGREFKIVYLDDLRLGFTSELGKNWELWQAYRELHSNAVDEGGKTFKTNEMPPAREGITRVIVVGSQYEDVYRKRSAIFLQSEPIFSTDDMEVHRGQSRQIYYRGVRVGELEQPSVYTYNILCDVKLTEDRTLAYSWAAASEIAALIARCENEEYIDTITNCEDRAFIETTISIGKHYTPSPLLKQMIGDMVKNKLRHIPKNLFAYYLDTMKPEEHETPREISLTPIEEKQLAKAVAFCQKIGYDVTEYPILFSDGLGEGILGVVHRKQIYIARAAFDYGTKVLAGTLIEEYIHRHLGHLDFSRQFQEHCINKIVSLGEELQGEPL